MGYTAAGFDLTNQLVSYDPDAVIIGGDVAYDNGMSACYFSWDLFMNQFSAVDIKLNRLVPIVLSVGNHDVGFNSISEVNITVTERGPWYFVFYPQKFANEANKSGIPEYSDRTAFHYHTFGNIIHFNLDSGYLFEYGGIQSEWLSNKSKEFSS